MLNSPVPRPAIALHAWTAVTNKASNGVCRSLGFQCLGEEEIHFGDKRSARTTGSVRLSGGDDGEESAGRLRRREDCPQM